MLYIFIIPILSCRFVKSSVFVHLSVYFVVSNVVHLM